MSEQEPVEETLTTQERQLMAEIALTGSWQDAASNLGMTVRDVRNLFRKEAFKREYNNLFDTEDLRTAQKELEMMASDAASILDEVRKEDMTKKVQAQCPDCGKKFAVFVQVMNAQAKLKVAEILLKVAKIWKDEKNVKVEGTVQHQFNVNITLPEFIALVALDKRIGEPPPPHMMRRLEDIARQNGFQLPAPKVIEGQYRYIDNDDGVKKGKEE